jgi:ketosteroid isomerase-like protein
VPPANNETVLAFVEAINRADWDAAFTETMQGFEIDLSRAIGPYRGIYGIAEAKELFREFATTWQSLSIEAAAEDLVEADDAILASLTMNVHGRDGINVSSTVTWVWTIRDGKLARATMYQDRDEALAAVGLAG